MKLTDVLALILKKNKINHVFGLQGGAVVHMFDSAEKFNIGTTYVNHEVAAGLAATSYAKATNNMGCSITTTGPGSTNVITGLLAAWQDSTPCLFISGQARSSHLSYNKKVRQVGTQEVNICDIVRPITKFTDYIKKKEDFIPTLLKAIKIAKSGRPGPVWIDIPLEFQWENINLKKKKNLVVEKEKEKKLLSKKELKKISKSIKILQSSKRPLLILGYGIRLSNTENLIKKIILKHKIPFVTTWTAADIFPTKYKYNLGIIGMSGQRGGNKAVFDSDAIICLGTHLSIPHTTTLYDQYATKSKKIIVNIDKDQLKHLNIKFDVKINVDLKDYLLFLFKSKRNKNLLWNKKIQNFKTMNWYNPKITKEPNSNIFLNKLTKKIKEKVCIIVDGGGTALYAGFQSTIIKDNDRLICSSAISSMGTGLAETIGVWNSNTFKNLLCVIGDGSILMNIQDLQTIFHEKINVKIILVNNNGYLAIRNTQKEFLNGKYYGTHPKWKLSMPSFKDVAKSYKIKYISVKKNFEMDKIINKIIKIKGPLICELFVNENQDVLFKQGYKTNADGTFTPQPLSEMYPFLNKPIANTNN